MLIVLNKMKKKQMYISLNKMKKIFKKVKDKLILVIVGI